MYNNSRYTSEDNAKLRKINQNLKNEDLRNYDANILYEYDSSLSDEENIIRKFILKEKGRFLKKNKKYEQAIDFYESLLKNSYFINDYYIYRHLAIKYKLIKDYDNLLYTIERFFKSEIYGNPCQTNWFLYKLIDLENMNYITNEEIDKLLEYYENHGGLNKNKENSPIYLADRIFQRRNGNIEVDSQFRYEAQQEKYEIKEKGSYLERYQLYEDANKLYWDQINKTQKGVSDFYKKLAMNYEKLNDYPNELKVLTLFYKQRYHIVGRTTKEYFEKRLNHVNLALRTNYTVEDFLNDDVNIDGVQSDKKETKNDELIFKYAELYEKGLLTKEEFDKKKKELL